MEKKVNRKKLYFSIATAIIALILLIVWVGLAYYSLNKISSDDRMVVADTKFIAHRGYSTLYMENTIHAFKAAFNDNYFQGVETDVWQTLDGVFVCSHNINPFVDKSINITTSNFDDIKNLPLDISLSLHDIDKNKTYVISTLREYLSACSVSSKYALVEIKQKFSSVQIDELISFINSNINYKKVFFGCFDKSTIELIHKKAPYYKVLLFTNSTRKSKLYATLGYNIGVSQKAINSTAIKTAHKNNSYTFVYTVENKEQLSKYVSISVDFIICDGILA